MQRPIGLFSQKAEKCRSLLLVSPLKLDRRANLHTSVFISINTGHWKQKHKEKLHVVLIAGRVGRRGRRGDPAMFFIGRNVTHSGPYKVIMNKKLQVCMCTYVCICMHSCMME
jgi:hypothetical protein